MNKNRASKINPNGRPSPRQFVRPIKTRSISIEEESENLINVTLSPWIILSDDKDVAVSPDWVVTVVEPIKSLKEMFEEKINGKKCKVSAIES